MRTTFGYFGCVFDVSPRLLGRDCTVLYSTALVSPMVTVDHIGSATKTLLKPLLGLKAVSNSLLFDGPGSQRLLSY